MTVRSSCAARIACFVRRGARPIPGMSGTAVPSCAAAAPRASAAGNRVVSPIARRWRSPAHARPAAIPVHEIERRKHRGARMARANVPRCAPASAPCATISIDAGFASMRPSCTVVAVPRMVAPFRPLMRAIASLPGMPKVKLKIGGRAASTLRVARRTDRRARRQRRRGRPKAACTSASSASIGAGSSAFALWPSAGKKVHVEGPVGLSALSARWRRRSGRGGRVRPAAPASRGRRRSRPPRRCSGVDGPPPIGPWMTGLLDSQPAQEFVRCHRGPLLSLCRCQTQIRPRETSQKMVLS